MAGKLVHFEIAAGDTGRALDFYKGLFGWSFEGMEGPVEYHMTRLEETMGGAVYPGDPGAHPRLLRRRRHQRGRRQACRSSAERPTTRQPVPGMGWFATGADTEGNPIGLWQTDPSATMPERLRR